MKLEIRISEWQKAENEAMGKAGYIVLEEILDKCKSQSP